MNTMGSHCADIFLFEYDLGASCYFSAKRSPNLTSKPCHSLHVVSYSLRQETALWEV